VFIFLNFSPEPSQSPGGKEVGDRGYFWVLAVGSTRPAFSTQARSFCLGSSMDSAPWRFYVLCGFNWGGGEPEQKGFEALQMWRVFKWD